jgi:hypothetical protein
MAMAEFLAEHGGEAERLCARCHIASSHFDRAIDELGVRGTG